MKPLLLVLPLLLACEPLPEAVAMQRAAEWSTALGLKLDSVTCRKCSIATCLCDAKIDAVVVPLECEQSGCGVRIR